MGTAFLAVVGAYFGYAIALNWLDGWIAILIGGFVGFWAFPAICLFLWALLLRRRKYKKIQKAMKVIDEKGFDHLLDLIGKKAKNLTSWESYFYQDIRLNLYENPDFFGDNATVKQLNSLVVIYLERVKGIEMKDESYVINFINKGTGEITELHIKK